ncbi:MAG: hypothetical protein ABR525_00340 [Candidatus Limnocylindria bacterium]
MADFKPVEANKARILMVKTAPPDTRREDANAEWIEVRVELSADVANWRVQRLRALWKNDIARPVESEWLYTWGSPAFVRAGEVFRVHSGSRMHAALHPLADDLAPGRKHVYVVGPEGAARLHLERGDYVRLIDAFGTVIDEVVVWPADPTPAQKVPAERAAPG